MDYLGRNAHDRHVLREVLDRISARIPDSAIFGGMIRDFAWGEVRNFSSDIDVVCDSSAEEIYSVIKTYRPKVNKFGGYRFFVGPWMFDVWAARDTWAFANGIVAGGHLDAMLKTTFFGVDAVLFHLGTRECLFGEEHRVGIEERLLDINLEANPSPDKVAIRAIKLALKHNARMSGRLCQFVARNSPAKCGSLPIRAFVNEMAAHLDRAGDSPFNFSPQLTIQYTDSQQSTQITGAFEPTARGLIGKEGQLRLFPD